MRIQFDVPADTAYAARVGRVLSDVYLRKYRYIGIGLVVLGVLGIWLDMPDTAVGRLANQISWTVAAVGILSTLFPSWARFNARRRLDGLATEGSYDIDPTRILMRSGGETGALAWSDVTAVREDRGFWVVFTGRVPYTVIPQEFMTPDDRQALHTFLTAQGYLPAPQLEQP